MRDLLTWQDARCSSRLSHICSLHSTRGRSWESIGNLSKGSMGLILGARFNILMRKATQQPPSCFPFLPSPTCHLESLTISSDLESVGLGFGVGRILLNLVGRTTHHAYYHVGIKCFRPFLVKPLNGRGLEEIWKI